MDISDTIAPNSTQLDAVDLITGERVFTISRVTGGPTDQPVNIHLAEFDRPWRPGLSMRRVLISVWGKETDAYLGRRVELYCDPTVEWAGQPVGGIRISRMSHIDGPKKVPLIVTKGRSAMWPVKPLPDDVPTSATSAPTEAPLPDRIDAAINAYARASITVPMLEAKVALPRDDWGDETVSTLEALFRSLSAGETTKAAEFDTGGEQ